MNTTWMSQNLSPTARRYVLAALVGFVLLLSVQYAWKIRKAGTSEANAKSAVVRWQEQIRKLQFGVDIYERYAYPNPPIMAMLLLPLAQLPPKAFAMVWFFLKVGMIVLALVWLFRMIEHKGVRFPDWAKALTLLLCLRPFMGDLSHGNINLFIMFLVVGAMYAYFRGLDFAAGLCVALGIACKLTPALLLPYFAWKRAWSALVGSAAGLALFLWVLPGAYFGFDFNRQLLVSYHEQMIAPFVEQGKITSEHNNQSLPGLLARLLSHSPSFCEFPNNEYTPVEWHNLTDWPIATVHLLVKGSMLAFALLIVWTCRTPREERGGWRTAAEFALIVLAMLLFSERTWKHHCVTLIVPFAVLSYCLVAVPLSRGMRWYLAGTAAAVLLLMASTSTTLVFESLFTSARLEKLSKLDDTSHLAKLAQVYGAYTWAFLLLLSAMGALLKQPTAQQSESESLTQTPPTAQAA